MTVVLDKDAERMVRDQAHAAGSGSVDAQVVLAPKKPDGERVPFPGSRQSGGRLPQSETYMPIHQNVETDDGIEGLREIVVRLGERDAQLAGLDARAPHRCCQARNQRWDCSLSC